MHEIVISVVCVATFVGTLGYIFFSKPKVKTEKYSPLFNASVTWGGDATEKVFENYKKATFRGEHQKH